MTEEKIKQNAEMYAKKHERILNYHHDETDTDFEDKRSAYIAGAHSRDEEIEELQKKLEDMTKLKNYFASSLEIYDKDNKELQEEIKFLKDNEKELFDGFIKRGTTLGGLMKENVKLNNPWISVEERLPKYCTVPSTEQYIKNRRYWDSKVAPIYLVICSDKQGDYYQFSNFIKFPEDKKPSWVFTGDNIKRNCVTHWMSIPELQK